MALAKPYYISPAFAFVAYPNRDSTPYREWYNIPEADTVVRGTLRYQGFPEFIRTLVQLGWLDAQPKEWVTEDVTWAEATKRASGANAASER
jgi:spermidine synthase / saccharopine dehydrogenase (NADP+, L-glutamate-forming)